MTLRQQLRARYPVILAHASFSFGDGWIGIMEALCERLSLLPVKKNRYGVAWHNSSSIDGVEHSEMKHDEQHFFASN